KYQFRPMIPDLQVKDHLYIVAEAWTKHLSNLLRHDGYMATFDETVFGGNHTISSPIIQFDKSNVNSR
ncbi:hypothetical protein COCVIDRAFT_98265, partial [Bipolaris victoriae FI3]